MKASKTKLSYTIPGKSDLNSIKAAVAGWLSTNKYADVSEVFESGNNADIKALIAVYNNAQ